MKVLEVRCCCTPQKLLGYLPEPIEGARMRAFPLAGDEFSPPNQVGVVLEVHTYAEHEAAPPINGPISLFEFKERHNRGWKTSRAYKAEGVPIETLRRIPGFLEAVYP